MRRILHTTLLAAMGCAAAPVVDDLDGDTDDSQAADTDGNVSDTDADTDAIVDGPCPSGMAQVGSLCVDRWEARLEAWNGTGWEASSPFLTVDGRRVRAAVPMAGQVPQAYISGTESAAACVEAGKRLCTSEEWLLVCRGPDGFTWPYGDTHTEGACNDAYAGNHPVVDYFGTSTGVWDAAHINDPGIDQQSGTVSEGGAFSGCVTASGVYDLHGNLNEWVDDPEGTFRGGSYADAAVNGPGCTYTTTAHDTAYHDYGTGFRCCMDATQ